MTVGADLDLTLIDTRKATAVALEKVNTDCRVAIDVAEFVSRLGLPLRDELARWIPAERVQETLQVYRTAFLHDGLPTLSPLPGATDPEATLRERGGRLVVITSRLPRTALACLQAQGPGKVEICPFGASRGSQAHVDARPAQVGSSCQPELCATRTFHDFAGALGIRYLLASMLAVAVCAVLAGAITFTRVRVVSINTFALLRTHQWRVLEGTME
jgi:hypothetical protein